MTNPTFNRLLFLCSFVGLLVAGYLWRMHATPSDIPCGPSRGCETVAMSIYSRFPWGTGPPVAAWGTAGYLGLATLAFLRSIAPDNARRSRTLLLLILAGASAGVAASLTLTYLEVFVIHAICKWCIASQGIIGVVWTVAVTEWARGGNAEMANKKQWA